MPQTGQIVWLRCESSLFMHCLPHYGFTFQIMPCPYSYGTLPLFFIFQSSKASSSLSLPVRCCINLLSGISIKQGELRRILRVSRNLINSLIEGTTDVIFVKDRKGRYLLFNTAAEKITGKAAAEVIGNDDTFLFSAGEAGEIMAGDRRVMDAGMVMTYEDYLTAADGKYRTFLATKGPIFDAAGEVTGLFGISRDITDHARAEEVLRKAKNVTITV